MNRTLRLVAGSLALALPFAAAAGCGLEKKKTIKQEFSAAEGYLSNSKAASFTLHMDDSQGKLLALMTKDGNVPPAIASAVLKGSITYVADPAGDATLKSVKAGASPTDLKAALDKVNLAFVVRDANADLAELRLVGGDLYAHVNLTEIGVLAKAGGVDDFDTQLNDAVRGMDPSLAKGLSDVRAGKWIKLPLSKYVGQLQDMAKGALPSQAPSSGQLSDLGTKAFRAVKPYVKVTDANNSSTDRVLDVKVQVRPALKALLAMVKSEKGLPFAGMLGGVAPSEIDKNVAAGTANGTITLHNSHLTQVAVDIDSIRKLDPTSGSTNLAGLRVVVDIDDSASPVAVPSNVSTFDVGAILDQFLKGFSRSFSGSASGSFSGSYSMNVPLTSG